MCRGKQEQQGALVVGQGLQEEGRLEPVPKGEGERALQRGDVGDL